MGDRTGKSTTVRSLVDLPGKSSYFWYYRGQSVGQLTLALTEGVKAFEPGLLAKANRGILYVDEHRDGTLLKGREYQFHTLLDLSLLVQEPQGIPESYKGEQEKLQNQISSARSALSSVTIDHDLRVKISKVCAELNVDGLRGDIVTNRAARALAALKGE
ncbi:hypothetical protein HAX54_021112 [Datura stramonium]|uniref:magnesium chelatase n=1 Tax=Datura stramonium TaxID=4076 RepID=A0ABS8S382_DATST|nr:hypothetical protein [Datura stramonium]